MSLKRLPLDTEENVKTMFAHIPQLLESRFYVSNLDASDLLLDLQLAIQKAKLTEEETHVIQFLYFEDLPMRTIAEKMDGSIANVYKRKESAIQKITDVFRKWGYVHEV